MNYMVGVGKTSPPIYIKNPRLNTNQLWVLTSQGARQMANALLLAAEFVENGPQFKEIPVENSP